MADPFGPFALPGYRDTLPPFQPGGYATLVSGATVHTADQASKTTVYYTQDAHNAFPIIKNGTRRAVYFDEPRLVLSSAHAASSIYDVFGVERNGKGHLVSGPVWTTGGGSITAGSCARGTGGGSTELARAGGAYVNRWGIAGLNGDGSQYVNPGEGCYLFSIFIDGSAGQVTCHRAWGASRKWGLWNAYNRKPIFLKAGDSTASWTYATATFRASRGQSTNSLTVFCGLAEEVFDLSFAQNITLADDGGVFLGIGWNSTSAASGLTGTVASSSGDVGQPLISGCPPARFWQAPALGIHVVTSLEYSSSGTNTFSGTEASMVLSGRWMG